VFEEFVLFPFALLFTSTLYRFKKTCRYYLLALMVCNVLSVFPSMARRKQSVLVGLPTVHPEVRFFGLDRRDLDHIVDVLNEKQRGADGQDEPKPLARALIELLERLRICGGNLQKMMESDPELGQVIATACIGAWQPTTTGRALMVVQPSPWMLFPPKHEQTPERFAAMLFHVGTLNPEWDKLAGPCARCGRYYLKKRASQKVYCSRRCGNAATAVERTRERIESERKDKLHRAKTAIKEWRSAKTQEDWKRWVAKRAGVDLRFITRAVTKHDIVPPMKGRKP
jgi:hypothetical protein